MLLTVMWLIWLLLVTSSASQRHTSDQYTAAVVEYASPSLAHLSADEVLENNTATYIEFIKEAELNQVDIIVFPEGGLHGHNRNKYLEIPAAIDRISPCDFNTTYHAALVKLSCAARQSNLYVVVNLNELYINSSYNKTEYYNTNVAFDRNGTVVGRYRKFNPYGEAVTKPVTPDHHIFKTDFGVSFGMFICFDLEFLEPAIVLAREYGVKHFVFSHCWISELPFLTALQAQWGWAYSLDVVLLASGCNSPSTGGTGSGIYHGRRGPLRTFQTNAVTSKLLIANVSKTFDCNIEDGVLFVDIDKKYDKEPSDTFEIQTDHQVAYKRSLVSTTHNSGSTLPRTPGVKHFEEDTNSSLVMLRDYLDVYKSLPLLPNYQDLKGDLGNLTVYKTTETTLCHNSFCCDFKVEMTMSFSKEISNHSRRGDEFSDQLYRLVVFDGVRWYGGGLATGGIQVCGVVACLNSSISSCGLRADDPIRQPQVFGGLFQTGTVFHKISLTPSFLHNSTFVYPDILVTGTGDEFGELMPSSNFTYEEFGPYNNSLICSLSIKVPVPNLISAAVYARQFDRDGQRRTELSSGDNAHKYRSLLPFIILFVSIILV